MPVMLTRPVRGSTGINVFAPVVASVTSHEKPSVISENDEMDWPPSARVSPGRQQGAYGAVTIMKPQLSTIRARMKRSNHRLCAILIAILRTGLSGENRNRLLLL